MNRLACQMLSLVTDRAWTSGDKLGFLGLGLGLLSLRCRTQREAVQLVETWPNPRDPLVWCRQSEACLVTNPCLESRGQGRVSRVRVFSVRILGLPSLRCQTQREAAQLVETWPNPRDPLVWCRHSKAGLVTDHAWAPGSRVRVSRVMVFKVNSVSGARHRGSQPSWSKPGLNPGDPLVG